MQQRKTQNGLPAILAFLIAAAPSVLATDPAVEALELYRAGKCGQAEPLLRDILSKQPKNTAVHKLLASCLLQLHRPAEARQEYTEVLKIVPGDPEAVRGLQPPPPQDAPAPRPAAEPSERARAGAALENAEKLIAAGKLDEAERMLADLARRAPDLAIPRERLAEIYTRRNQYEKAASVYVELAGKHSGTLTFRLRAAQNFAWQQEYGPAADNYRQYLLQRPADSGAQLELAGVLLWWNHLDEAAEAYRSYLERHGDDADARLNLGDALLWSKRFEEAAGEFRRVLAKRPNDSDAQYGLGQCYESTSQLDLALQAYRKAAELNPQNQKATEARDRMAADLPQRQGFERLEKREYASAAGAFLEYLKQHPDSAETMLEVARVYSWGKLYADAAQYYDRYLERVPGDDPVRRELAKVELTIPDFPRAQEQYARLAAGGHGSVEDYEGLVHALVWDNKLDESQPYAEKLAALAPGNPVALESRQLYRQHTRGNAFEAAQKLASAGRMQEAKAVYTDYAAKFGTDREIDLAICRLYSWAKEYPAAGRAYQEFIRRYGEDRQARLELADTEKYAGLYADAESDYRSVLAHDPGNAGAMLGLAQISDYRGDDRFAVVKAYRAAAAQDPDNSTPLARLAELGPRVSPALEYHQTSFSDSDAFARSVNRFEGAFPVRGGLKLMPYFGYDYFSQDRQSDGTACGSKVDANPLLRSLDTQICARNGTVHALGAGGRIELAPDSHFSLLAEGYQARFDNDRTTSQYRFQADIHSATRALTVSVEQRAAVYDVNTISSLFDGIRGRHAFLSYQQSLSQRWRLWVMGGLSDYSRSASGASPEITQRRFGARLDYIMTADFTAGYYARGSSFSQASPLFFSPSYYGTYGLAYAWRKAISSAVRMRLDGEVGYGRINRFATPGIGTLEVMLNPAFEWKMRPDVNLVFGYRYGRGRSSAFGSPVYSSGSLDFRIETSFAPPVSSANPARLNLQ